MTMEYIRGSEFRTLSLTYGLGFNIEGNIDEDERINVAWA